MKCSHIWWAFPCFPMKHIGHIRYHREKEKTNIHWFLHCAIPLAMDMTKIRPALLLVIPKASSVWVLYTNLNYLTSADLKRHLCHLKSLLRLCAANFQPRMLRIKSPCLWVLVRSSNSKLFAKFLYVVQVDSLKIIRMLKIFCSYFVYSQNWLNYGWLPPQPHHKIEKVQNCSEGAAKANPKTRGGIPLKMNLGQKTSWSPV